MTKIKVSPIPENLRAAMERAGMKAKQLAFHCKVSEATVSLWLSGKRSPRMDNMLAITIALDVEMCALWEGEQAYPATPTQHAMLQEMSTMDTAQQTALLALTRTMKKRP